MIPNLKFGDVFTSAEKEYIFLGINGDVLFAARILDYELSKQVEKVFFGNVAKNKKTDRTLFCYVKLVTKEHKGKIASLTQPILDKNIKFKKMNLTINEKDQRNLQDEILNSHLAPKGLRELIVS